MHARDRCFTCILGIIISIIIIIRPRCLIPKNIRNCEGEKNPKLGISRHFNNNNRPIAEWVGQIQDGIEPLNRNMKT